MSDCQQVRTGDVKNTSSRKQDLSSKNIPSNHTHPAAIIQDARTAPGSLTPADVLQLQRTIGNQAVGQLLSEIGRLPSTSQQVPVQRQGPEDEEELMQGKFTDECVQCQIPEDEEELMQGKMMETVQRQGLEEEEELMQGKMMETVQRQIPEEEEELLQGKMMDTVQRQAPEEEELMQGKFASGLTGTLQAKEEAPPNRTGMPDHLKSGLENLSGMDLSGVRVYYSSSKPPQFNAFAYTQGQEIHVAPGQDKHLPHEGWHAVQQMQGRVKPTLQAKGVSINDDAGLEKEADVMGKRAGEIGQDMITHDLTHVMQQSNSLQLEATVQCLTEKQKKDVGAELFSWPQYDQVKGIYPVVDAMNVLMAADGWDYEEKLPICVTLHVNANRAVNLIRRYPGEENDVLSQIEAQKGKMGVTAGNLFHPMYKMQIQSDPDEIGNYFRYVIDQTNTIWETLDAKNQLSLTRLVFNQEKGYDWARIDMENVRNRFMEARTVIADPGPLITVWLETPSNIHPFTAKQGHLPSPDKWLAQEWPTYGAQLKESAYGTWWYYLRNKTGQDSEDMPDYINENRLSLVDAFSPVLGEDRAWSVVEQIHQKAWEYA